MAIAFDASSTGGEVLTTTQTWSHTCTGSNRILFVGVASGNNSVTGVTYNGVSMTKAGTELAMTGIAAGQYLYQFYLINPASGANNIVVTCTVANFLIGLGSSYTGAKQSGQPDQYNTNVSTSTTSLATSVTTVADNCWLVGNSYNLNAASGGTNTTIRNNALSSVCTIFDSNQAYTPAGNSRTLTITQSAGFAGMTMCSFAPAVTVTTSGNFFNFF